MIKLFVVLLCLWCLKLMAQEADVAIIKETVIRPAEIGKPGETEIFIRTESGRMRSIKGKVYKLEDRLLPLELLSPPKEGLCPLHNKMLKEGRCEDCEDCRVCGYEGGHNRFCPYDYINSKEARVGLSKEFIARWKEIWIKKGWDWEKGKWKEE